MKVYRNPVSVAVIACVLVTGCSRTEYRLQADREVYETIAEKNVHPEWSIDNYQIEMDHRSRYFEPFDPDRPPMPPDDPVSHEFMHHVDGKEGWDHWHDFGNREELENPDWAASLGEYVALNAAGDVRLTLDSSLRLAYMHSPAHQGQLETLYLSSLDVTTERFRLDTQYSGGLDAAYTHNGRLRPESNLLTIGRGNGAQGVASRFGGGANVLQANKRFASAAELIVGVANSFAWEFTNGDINFAGSLINAGFVQPLLRGAGRDIALEQLTIVERALLGNIRAYYQYRQGFFTRVAIGDQGVGGLQRRGGFFGGTGLTGFTGQGAGGFGGVGGGTFGGGFGGGGGGGTGGGAGFAGGGAGTVGGFIGLLQQLQQIRNSEDSLNQQLRTLSVLEAHLQAGVIDLTQVDQFRQSIETEKATLLQSRNGLKFGVEGFLSGTLGLPPKLPVEIDDSLIRKFQLVTPDATRLQDRITLFQDQVGRLADDADTAAISGVLTDISPIVKTVQLQFDAVQNDLMQMNASADLREKEMLKEERRLFGVERQLSHEGFQDLIQEFEQARKDLHSLTDGLNDETRADTVRGAVVWLRNLHRLVQGSILIQARARLESISVEKIQLDSDTAVKVALGNRLDWMNGRASLVDSWRLIAFNADALQANVSIAAGGTLRTAGDNPIRIDARNSTVTAGVQFDAPFTRLLERNNYRQALIDYQRSRRGFIQGVDGLELGLRGLLRQIEQLRINLEIQRRAVAIAIRRVDKTREDLNAPVPPPQPGRPPAQFGPTAATSLLTALSDLRNTQNNFMSVWLNYYAAKMRLARNLGLMELDKNGKWIDKPLPTFAPDGSLEGYDNATQLPPPVPPEWVELVDHVPVRRAASEARPANPAARMRAMQSTAFERRETTAPIGRTQPWDPAHSAMPPASATVPDIRPASGGIGERPLTTAVRMIQTTPARLPKTSQWRPSVSTSASPAAQRRLTETRRKTVRPAGWRRTESVMERRRNSPPPVQTDTK